jgi:hypothetical protein
MKWIGLIPVIGQKTSTAFSLTWEQIFKTTTYTWHGPKLDYFELFKFKYVVIEVLSVTGCDVAIVKLDMDDGQAITLATSDILGITGARWVRQTETAFPGRQKEVKFIWKPTNHQHLAWNAMTITSVQVEDNYWKKANMFRVFMSGIDPQNASWQSTVGYNVAFRISVYFQVAQYSGATGFPPPSLLSKRVKEENLMRNEVQMHRDGVTNVIDLSMLDLSDDDDCIIVN